MNGPDSAAGDPGEADEVDTGLVDLVGEVLAASAGEVPSEGVRPQLSVVGHQGAPEPPASAHSLLERLEEALSLARPVSRGGAYVCMRAEAARREAAPGGRPAGPLDEVLLAVKDLIAVADLPRGAGSAVYADAPPEREDAAVVASLRRAGAVVVGTTALHELGFGVTGVNPSEGTPAHPLDPERIPGGSSSGSALAVAEGSADLSLGTDTGGSVRIPAALCGVVGFKPRYRTYATTGVLPLAPSLDHVGLFARTVGHIAEAHRVLCGEPTSPARPWRVGLASGQLDSCDPEVASAVAAAVERVSGLGVEVVEVDLPQGDLVFAASTAILFSEAAAEHHDLVGAGTLIGEEVRRRLATGRAMSAVSYLLALQAQARLRAEVAAVLAEVPVVLGPVCPVLAPRRAEIADAPALAARLVTFTRLANLTGYPAASLPIPGAALPVGLQALGASNAEVLAFSSWFSSFAGLSLAPVP